MNYRHPAGVAVNNTYEDRPHHGDGQRAPRGLQRRPGRRVRRFISDTMDLALFRSLATRAGGEVTGDF